MSDLERYHASTLKCLRAAKGTKGLLRPLTFRVFSRSFEMGTSVVDDRDPFILFRSVEDESSTKDIMLKRAISLCKTGLPTRKFGLSLMDIMELDLATFNMVDDACAELLEDIKTGTASIAEDFESLT